MSLFLGLDSSTQSLTALIIDVSEGEIVANEGVNFGRDLPEFNCPNGVRENPDPLIQHSDPLLWLAALDLVLAKLQKTGVAIAEIAGISGSGQQHGSVYLAEKFTEILGGMSSKMSLVEQIKPALTRQTSPIWMDSSTTEECREMAAAIGAAKIQNLTGSPPIERFTGPQIRRFSKLDPTAYSQTARIHLVSSFMASVLSGKEAGIDYGDGAGMNLLNLQELQWEEAIADAIAPNLLKKLPMPVASHSIAGKLHPYFAKYGLTAGTPVVVWSGDNPNSLIGTGAAETGTAVVSLGTSDTFFAALSEAKVDPDGCGHVFGNPGGGYMSLICFKNGSLARERIKDDLGVDWDYFGSQAFAESVPGNNGNLMLPYLEPEITPLVLSPGIRRLGNPEFCEGNAAPAVEIRAVVESQILSMRHHSAWIGDFNRIRVTGGGSQSQGICQILANVFQAQVEKIAVPDSAGLGAAMRAANAVAGSSWREMAEKFAGTSEIIRPEPEYVSVYDSLLEEYISFEQENQGA